MIVLTQKFIFRSDLLANPRLLYVFGDNEQRTGLGGQAKEMRGEENAFGIRTKRSPTNDNAAFWSDDNYVENSLMIAEDYHALKDALQVGLYQGLIIPEDGLGTGYSQMPKRCPRTFAYLNDVISLMKSMGD